MLVLCFGYQLFQHNVFWLTNYSYGWRKRWLEPYKMICRTKLKGETHFFDVREYFSPKYFFTNSISTGAMYPSLPPVREAYMHSLSKPRHDLTLKKQDMIWLSNYFPHYMVCLSKTSFPNQYAIWLKKSMIWLSNYFLHCAIWLSKNTRWFRLDSTILWRDLTFKKRSHDLA
jgi:hypothetical protein